jgi:hypothetical protein
VYELVEASCPRIIYKVSLPLKKEWDYNLYQVIGRIMVHGLQKTSILRQKKASLLDESHSTNNSSPFYLS